MSVADILAELAPLDAKPPAACSPDEMARWQYLNDRLGVELRASVLNPQEPIVSKYDPSRLAEECSADELEHRRDAALERIETRIERAQSAARDLTDREATLSRDDRAEIEACDEAVEMVRRRDETRDKAHRVHLELARMRGEQEIRQAWSSLADFEAGLRAGVPQRVAVGAEVFHRAATTATAGETVEVAARTGRPAFIWSVLGVPFFRAASSKVEGPTWTALAAQAATAEGGTKPTMADATLDSQQLAAYGVVHTVSDRVVRFGIGEDAVTARLAAEAVYSVNAGVIARLSTHGTELAFATDTTTSLDTAIAEVVARTGGATGIIINPAEYPAVAARSATNAADVESGTVSGYNGLRIFMHPSMAAGHGIVVNGSWLSAHATDVLLASLPKLSTNEIELRAECYAAVLIGDASAVQRVDLSSAA